jgi:hypothetical protein
MDRTGEGGVTVGAWRAVRLILVALVFAASAWLGLTEGVATLRGTPTTGQRIASITQILYGLAGGLCLIALRVRPAWSMLVLGLWVVMLTATGGLAPVVWGGATWLTGLLSGVATLLIAALVGWGYLAHIRSQHHLQLRGNP